MQRRLTTILAADVVGYSRLMGADEAGTHAALKAHRAELLEPKTAQYKGRTIKLMGDGALMEFPSVVEAVAFAVEVQLAMRARNRGMPEDRQILYRVGINIGDIIVEGDDIYGEGVNIAARLEALAEPGGIAISEDAYRQVRDRVDVHWSHAGERNLKNIERPVPVWFWQQNSLVATVEAIDAGQPLPLPDKPSIAVLPFQNMSGDENQEDLADGICEDIITALSRSPRLFVIARNSTFTYKGKPTDVKKIARELGIRYVLEGSVRKVGSRVRITAQLIEGMSAGHIWSDKYDRQLDDIFELQDDITRSVVASIDSQIIVHESHLVARSNPPNLTAWELARQAWGAIYNPTAESLQKAQQIAESAVAQDPTSSEAHQVLATCLWHRSWLGFVDDPQSYLAPAHSHAERAVELDQRNEYAYWICGATYLTLREYDRARTSLERAIELNPNCSLAYGTLGTVLSYAGEADDSIANNEIAIRINPLDPTIFFRFAGIAVAHFTAERYDAAMDWAKKTVLRSPAYFVGHAILIAALAHLGRINDAEEAAAEYRRRIENATIRKVANLPFQHSKHLQLLIEGLRRAGVPE